MQIEPSVFIQKAPSQASLRTLTGVHVGSNLAPELFAIRRDMLTAEVHLHADETLVHFVASSLRHAVDELQNARLV